MSMNPGRTPDPAAALAENYVIVERKRLRL